MIDRNHLITRNNLEIERIHQGATSGGSIGATFLFNLNEPVVFDAYGEHIPTDASLCRDARLQSPDAVFDADKPSWAETVTGSALGALDTVQVCHNHYHRTSTLPGGWGMIGPLAPRESNTAVDDGLFHRTNARYYRLLNCGFTLGVSGGSAIGVMSVPTGHSRVYAKVDGDLTSDAMWEAIKAGRSFATSGPMLSLDLNGQIMGATIARKSTDQEPLKVKTTVRSFQKLEALQIVHDGLIISSTDLNENQTPPIQKQLTFVLNLKRSSWVIARALFRAADGLLRQAHTSPIYLSVDEKPIAYAEDARYMLRWIDVLENLLHSQPNHIPNETAKLHVLKNYQEARLRYDEIIRAAQTHWKADPIQVS
ncbi:MAG: hypothetical protein ACI8T1_001881 [Verrucomicrobiales bacterium]